MTVVLKHESNLRPFRRNWDNILMGCHKRPEDAFLETLFLRNIKNCTCLKYDLDRYHFNRTEKGVDGLPTAAAKAFNGYSFLYNSVDNYLNRTLGESQRASHLQSLSGTTSLAPFPKGKGKGKDDRGKGKSKGKGNGKGKSPCKFFVAGTCWKGTNCTFSHEQGGAPDANAPGNQPGVQPTPGQSSPVCWFHNNGGCKRGEQCQKSHSSPVAPISKRKARKIAAIERVAAEEKKEAKKVANAAKKERKKAAAQAKGEE